MAGTIFWSSATVIGLYDFRSSRASTLSNLGCDIAVSSAKMLAAFLAAVSGVSPKKPEISLKDALKQPISTWKENIKNDFEEKLLLKYPTIAEVKETLYQSGAIYASMTGSGSTLYGIFEKEIDLKNTFPDFAMWQGNLQN